MTSLLSPAAAVRSASIQQQPINSGIHRGTYKITIVVSAGAMQSSTAVVLTVRKTGRITTELRDLLALITVDNETDYVA
jgi:hypothetical protein